MSTDGNLEGWRPWHADYLCPICSGWRGAGRSGKQCRGGFFAKTPQKVLCSVTPSARVSRSGKTFVHALAAPITDYVEETTRSASSGDTALQRMPWILERERRSGVIWKQTGRWNYRDAGGAYAYSALRYGAHDASGRPLMDPDGHPLKSYRSGVAAFPEKLDPSVSYYRFHVDRDQLVPFRLPELLDGIRAGLPVLFTEGERCASFVADHYPGRYAVTTNVGGALRFDKTPNWTPWLHGATRFHVIVDRDESGRRWARSVLDTLRKLDNASEIRVSLWQSATLGDGHDVIDHVENGHRLDALVRLKVEDL